jgi:hypothetical protein
VIDISSAGACLRLDDPSLNVTKLRLVIESVAPIPVVLAWRKSAHIGVRFLNEQHWVLESYRKRFDPAAWLADRV